MEGRLEERNVCPKIRLVPLAMPLVFMTTRNVNRIRAPGFEVRKQLLG